MNSAISVMIAKGTMPPVPKYQIRQSTEMIAAPAFSAWPPGSFLATEVTLPASLP